MSDRPPFFHTAIIPVAILLILTGVLYASVRISTQGPVIQSIVPAVASPGDEITISGSHFGKSRDRGHVSIAGIVPTTSGYKEWTEHRISVTVPDKVTSGLVYVVTDNGQSDGVLFTNRQNIPAVVSQSSIPGLPHIDSIDPASGPPGTLITIMGRNFGMNRGTGTVRFPWAAVNSVDPASPATEQTSIPALTSDYDYEGWADQEIKVRVPDGASTGNIAVTTEKGSSNPSYFELSQVVGTKTFRDKRSYAVHYGVNVTDVKLSGGGTAGNSLYLWIPRVQSLPAQRDIQLLTRNFDPMFENVDGLSLYRLDNLQHGKSYSLSLSYIFDRYAVETTIAPARVPTDYDENSELFLTYTAPSDRIPATSEVVRNLARSIVGRNSNPYLRARNVYDYLLKTLSYDPGIEDPIEAITQKKGNDIAYATLMTAILRNANIPARVVAGHVVDDNQQAVPHQWLEFYIANFGWVPVDPSLPDGALEGRFTLPDGAADYYFGNLDDRHITFSRGLLDAKRMDPNGHIAKGDQSFAVQTFAEETTGSLQSYKSVWDKLIIIGVY
ncbi:MAG TPA: transglutaminase domain-containing protein [Spirochaetia bacterium]|nr:transglutaminase domain-containing protein [Spirochaetia bacterium]